MKESKPSDKVTGTLNISKGLDLIGDVHGEFSMLESLLLEMGYMDSPDGWGHPEGRIAGFIGDLIDRGPDSYEVYRLVRKMVERGSAVAVMGNHELNAVFYHTRSEGSRDYLRRHTDANCCQHKETLDSFREHGADIGEFVEWVKTLPFTLELGNLRLVHAAWIESDIEKLGGATLTDPNFLQRAGSKSTEEFAMVERVLKGIEAKLPDGSFFHDHNGVRRTKARIGWWLDPHRKWKWSEVAIGNDVENAAGFANLMEVSSFMGKTGDDFLTFFGHYALEGNRPERISSNFACLDFGCAKGGPLVAYRYEGENRIRNEQFISIAPQK